MTKHLIFSSILAIFLVGCASHTKHKPEVIIAKALTKKNTLATENTRIQHVVEFSYNSAELPANAAIIIEPHVRYLFQNNSATAIIQGNASSEGTATYNYQLGLERANAVKGLMLELGLQSNRIKVASVGENTINSFPSRAAIISY